MSNPNDPAYPQLEIMGDGKTREWPGMTTRQEFVKAAMQGLCANPILCDVSEFAIAEQAVRHADAALAEEARTRGEK